MNDKSILIVEDDLNLGFLLSEFLEGSGYRAKLCRDGSSALEILESRNFDLCIVDVMMPSMDGFELASRLRETHSDLPFIFLTAKSRKEDRINGYSLGADDYVTKPFDEDELLCKLKVIFRRLTRDSMEETHPEIFQFGKFSFNYGLQELSYMDQVRRITEKENEILRLLCLHKNRILRRDDAVEKVYGRKDYFLGRSFDVFISRIRKMLRPDPSIEIENVFRVGFILKVSE